MIRLHKSDYVPKYLSGKWYFNEQEERIEFLPYTDLEHANEEYIYTNGYRFRKTLNQTEELAFRQKFMRLSALSESDSIHIKDIRNLVLFLMPSSFISRDFIKFVFSEPVQKFWHAMVIYFEHFLRFVEFIMIRRDEIAGDTTAQIQSTQSTDIKRVYSHNLSQYRLLVAREYSILMLGEGELQPYYHMKPIVNISMTIKDKHFYEHFLALTTQFVWIAMHRRAYDVIDQEMNRLLRSQHFQLPRKERIKYTPAEECMLYGKNYRRVNYRAQNSPLIQELANVTELDQPILWIGKRLYRGTDKRIAELELEYIIPKSQLCLVDITHGILGHPKKFYNTLLNIDWGAIRYENYTLSDDPYHIIRQPCLRIPGIDEEKIRQFSKHYQSYYEIHSRFQNIGRALLKIWLKRDKICEMFDKDRIMTNVYTRVAEALTDKEHVGFVDAALPQGVDLRRLKSWVKSTKRKRSIEQTPPPITLKMKSLRIPDLVLNQ